MSLSYCFVNMSGTYGCFDGFTFAGAALFLLFLSIPLTHTCPFGLAFSGDKSESIKAIIKGVSQQRASFYDTFGL